MTIRQKVDRVFLVVLTGTASLATNQADDFLCFMEIRDIAAPKDLLVHVSTNHTDSNRIPVECVFSSQGPGLRYGKIKLLALDSEGSEQPLELDYGTFVRP